MTGSVGVTTIISPKSGVSMVSDLPPRAAWIPPANDWALFSSSLSSLAQLKTNCCGASKDIISI